MPSRHTGSSGTMLPHCTAYSFETPIQSAAFVRVSRVARYETNGPQTQRAAAVEAGKRTGSTDIVLDSRQPEKPCPLWEKKNKRG